MNSADYYETDNCSKYILAFLLNLVLQRTLLKLNAVVALNFGVHTFYNVS